MIERLSDSMVNTVERRVFSEVKSIINKDNAIMTRLCEMVVPAASVIPLKSSLSFVKVK
jgi:hypothetical protein